MVTKINYFKAKFLGTYLRGIVIVLAVSIFIFPLLWSFNISLRQDKDIFTSELLFITRITFDHYKNIFSEQPFFHSTINTLILASITTLVALILGIPAGYSMARYGVGGKYYLLLILGIRLFPTITLIIPGYLIFSRLNLINTWVPMVTFYLLMALPLVIWISRAFFLGIPKEIEEAAQLDGCSILKTMFLISIPLIRSGIAVAATFSFIYSWNNLLIPLVFTMGKWETTTLTIAQFVTMLQLRWGELMAASIITIIPIFILTIFSAEHIMRGFLGKAD